VPRYWPEDFEERKRGKDCAFCKTGRVEEDRYGARIFAGRVSDAYLHRAQVQPGYTIAVWRGAHVADPTELSDADAAAYWLETLRVARALERYYRPLKLNFDMLGNIVPHLHTHIVPRYAIDENAGGPARFMMEDRRHPPIPVERYRDEVNALRALLNEDAAERASPPAPARTETGRTARATRSRGKAAAGARRASTTRSPRRPRRG
jgi:diadenosine tetraphosphate (Ap4A) HIT family hydrolase